MDIYIPDDQRTALAAIDTRELDELIEKAIQEERPGNLCRLHLAGCGPYIAAQFHGFERALARHREAKSSRKRVETGDYLQRASRDLVFGVQAMQRRMEEEKEEEQRFHVQGEFAPPYRFSQRLSARVSYRCRKTVNGEWTHGSITFLHEVDLTPDYSYPRPKRKPSAAKQQQEAQKQLSDTWEHLMRGGIYSVRDYLREGGDADKIPETFQAKVGDNGFLNNYSTQFWRQQS